MRCAKCGTDMNTCPACGHRPKRRTLSQNALAHALWGEFAVKMGLGPGGMELIKEAIKEQYGFKMRNPLKPDKFVVRPSSQYSIDDWNVLIEATYLEASMQGIILEGRDA